MIRTLIPRSALQVWAVEDTSVQITWGGLPEGPVVAWCHDIHVEIDHSGGPGSLDIGGLSPGTSHRIDMSWAGGRAQLEAKTLPVPPGRELCRIATISDLHIGSTKWGATKLMADRSGHDVPFPLRCARAAVADAFAWGADLLIIKGDAVHHQDSDHFDALADLLDEFDELPMLLIPGNHDVDGVGDCEVPTKLGTRGLPYIRGTACEDLNGVRVIVADTTVPGIGPGSVDRPRDDIVELAELAAGPYLLGLHHQLQRFRFPTHYPSGVAAPASIRLLDELSAVNPNGVVTSGHTHRNRARRHGPLTVSEVGSTRDWPGVWAGYVVHEGGIRQLVRRATQPEAMHWHEYSRRALLGWWGQWSAGPLTQRCFVHRWLRT